jgi:hypothetical protein
MVMKRVERVMGYFWTILHYWLFILVGLLIAAGSLVKVIGIYEFSSDWLWFLAGVGLMVEGAISLMKQRKFDRKYKIVERKD